MVAWFSHASGIIISTACQIGRPPRWSSSRHSSKLAVSDAPGRADREGALEPGDERGLHQRLAGAHPVAVALHGVDLAVVREVAVRVGQRPRRERVGGEAAVHQRERGLDPLVGEVGEELGELRGGEHPLVDEGAARQRREVDRLAAASGVASSCSQRLRTTNSLRSSSMPGRCRLPEEPGSSTKSCRKLGTTLSAVGPIIDESTGTVRQPRTRRPSSSTMAFTRATVFSAASGSSGQEGEARRRRHRRAGAGSRRRPAGSGRGPGSGCRRRHRC